MELDAGQWERLPVQRQAWLVCGEQAKRRSRRWFDVITRIGLAGQGERSSGLGVDVVNADRNARLGAMQFAASELVPRLTDQEVAKLREDRVLPDWFMPELMKLAKVIERDLRRG